MPKRGHIFRMLDVLSLLMCIATAYLWVRSFSTFTYLHRKEDFAVDPDDSMRRHSSDLCIMSAAGGLHAGLDIYYYSEEYYVPGRSPRWECNSLPSMVANVMPPEAGFSFIKSDNGPRWGNHHVVRTVDVHYWFPTALFSLLPAIALINRCRRPRKHRPGFCTACGYDLRATPERCPECGVVPPLSNKNYRKSELFC